MNDRGLQPSAAERRWSKGQQQTRGARRCRSAAAHSKGSAVSIQPR